MADKINPDPGAAARVLRPEAAGAVKRRWLRVHDRGLRRVTNPADLSALEMALQLAAQHRGTVTAWRSAPTVSMTIYAWPWRWGQSCRAGLELGVPGWDAVADAHLVARLIEIFQPDLVFLPATG